MNFTSLTYNFDLPLMKVLQGSDSLFIDRAMYFTESSTTWIVLYVALFVLILKNNETMKQMSLFFGCALFAILLSNVLVDSVMNPLFMRLRPTNDPMLKYTINTVNGLTGDKYGFFSANASSTMSVALFFWLVVKRHSLGILLVIWSLVCGYSRIYLGLNFPSDIILGHLWGLFIAFISYVAYNYVFVRISVKGNFVSSQYTPAGYLLADIYWVEAVILLTYIYILIRCIFPI